jgi:hypothetical protein
MMAMLRMARVMMCFLRCSVRAFSQPIGQAKVGVAMAGVPGVMKSGSL